MTNIDQDTTPWFKQFWPWFLISIPAITICYCALMIYMAITTENSLVSDNYYKDGLAINQSLSMDKKAKELHLNAELMFFESARVSLKLKGDFSETPSFLTLKLLHPTIDGRDVEIKLLPEPGGIYSTLLEEPLKGRWHIDVIAQDATWRLKGEGGFPSSTPLILNSDS